MAHLFLPTPTECVNCGQYVRNVMKCSECNKYCCLECASDFDGGVCVFCMVLPDIERHASTYLSNVLSGDTEFAFFLPLKSERFYNLEELLRLPLPKLRQLYTIHWLQPNGHAVAYAYCQRKREQQELRREKRQRKIKRNQLKKS